MTNDELMAAAKLYTENHLADINHSESTLEKFQKAGELLARHVLDTLAETCPEPDIDEGEEAYREHTQIPGHLQ